MFLSNGQSLSRLKKDAKQQAKAESIKLSEAQEQIANKHGYRSWANMVKSSELQPTLKLSLPDKAVDDWTQEGIATPPTFLLQANGGRIGFINGPVGSGKAITSLHFIEQALLQGWEVFALGYWSSNEKTYLREPSQAMAMQLLKHEHFHPVHFMKPGVSTSNIINYIKPTTPKTLYVFDEVYYLFKDHGEMITGILNAVELPIKDHNEMITGLLNAGYPTIFVSQTYSDFPNSSVLFDLLKQDSLSSEKNSAMGFILDYSPNLIESMEPFSLTNSQIEKLSIAEKLAKKVGANIGFMNTGMSFFAKPDINEMALTSYCGGMEPAERTELLQNRVFPYCMNSANVQKPVSYKDTLLQYLFEHSDQNLFSGVVNKIIAQAVIPCMDRLEEPIQPRTLLANLHDLYSLFVRYLQKFAPLDSFHYDHAEEAAVLAYYDENYPNWGYFMGNNLKQLRKLLSYDQVYLDALFAEISHILSLSHSELQSKLKN